MTIFFFYLGCSKQSIGCVHCFMCTNYGHVNDVIDGLASSSIYNAMIHERRIRINHSLIVFNVYPLSDEVIPVAVTHTNFVTVTYDNQALKTLLHTCMEMDRSSDDSHLLFAVYVRAEEIIKVVTYELTEEMLAKKLLPAFPSLKHTGYDVDRLRWKPLLRYESMKSLSYLGL